MPGRANASRIYIYLFFKRRSGRQYVQLLCVRIWHRVRDIKRGATDDDDDDTFISHIKIVETKKHQIKLIKKDSLRYCAR